MYPVVPFDAVKVFMDEAFSALPDAPVVPDTEPRLHRTAVATRLAAARTLRRVADRLEPVAPVTPVGTDCG